jgi:hypothetical protein
MHVENRKFCPRTECFCTFFFHWHYSPRWALACRTKSFHFFYVLPTLTIIVKSIQLFPLFDFRNNKFLLCGVVSPTPNTWRTRVSLFVWVITLDLSGMGGSTNSIRYRQHSSWDHVTTQAPPLRQSRDTFGGECFCTE